MRPVEPGPCESCRHYRRGTSTAAQVGALMPGHARAKALTQIQDMHDREREQRADEAASRVGALTLRLDHRPTGFAYCGELETAAEWHDIQVKNPDNRTCGTRSTGAPDRSCGTCRHRVSPGLAEYDRTAALLARFSGVGSTSESGKRAAQLWSELRTSCEANATWELRMAYDGVGTLPARPAQLPWCRALSTEADRRWVVGDIVNVGRACPEWEQGEPTAAETASDVAWAESERTHALVEDERDQLKKQGSSISPHQQDVLAQLRYEHHEAAAGYLRVGLARLGLTATEADAAATELQSALLSTSPKPWRKPGIPVPVADHEVPASRPVPAGPGRARRRGGLLDALMGLTSTPAADPKPAPPRPAATTSPRAPSRAPRVRDDMDPADDGGFVVAGLHANPADPTVVVNLVGREGTTVLVAFGRTTEPDGAGRVLERHDIAAAAAPGPTVLVHKMINGHWFIQGQLAAGRWWDAQIVLGAAFAARIGFVLAATGPQVRVQWLDATR